MELLADTRVKKYVESVNSQVYRGKGESRKQYDALNNRIITVPDGLHRQPTDSGPGKNGFNNCRTTDNAGNLQADNGYNRDKCISQHMNNNHSGRRQSFGVCRLDIRFA